MNLVHVKFVQIYLLQKIYYPNEETVFRYESNIICSKRIINLPENESELYFDQFLAIPSVPPSSDEWSRSLKISYKFKIKVVVPGPKLCPTVEVPIIILKEAIEGIVSRALPTYEQIENSELPSYDDAVKLK